MAVELTLAFPPPLLSPNARPHRYAKSRAVRDYKDYCWYATRSEMNRLSLHALAPPVKAEIVFVVKNMRRDLDNCLASFKAGLDGIVASGLLVDDNAKALTISASVIKGTAEEVRIRLEGAI